MKTAIRSLEEMNAFTKGLAGGFELGTQAIVLALSGDLGAGKTAFTKELASVLGVVDVVTSPTFVIEKIYKLSGGQFEHLIHIDAYRLEKSEELAHLGFQDILSNPRNIIVIEWPEKVADLIPKDAKSLKFTFIDETTREIEYA